MPLNARVAAGALIVAALPLTAAGATAVPTPDVTPAVITGPQPIATATGFVLPVPPPAIIVTPFDPPDHRYGRGHRGVDLLAVAGSPVRAAGPGVVVYAGPLAGRGVISIEHAGGLRTTYEPVAAGVGRGRHVDAGDVIGTVQAGHFRCDPVDCLHFGARLPGEVYVNPMALIGPWQVRLKPWG